MGGLTAATNGAVTGTTLQIPTTEYYAATETASLASVAAVRRLLQTYLD